MARVYEVEDPIPNLHRRLALKVMNREVAANEGFVRRFESEAGLASGLDHRTLMTIYDYGRDEELDLYYYVMNFVDGPNLSRKVEEEGALDLKTAGQVYLEVLDALAHLHDHAPPIIHRDIKPSNIFLTRAGHPYLGDLGIARQEGAAGLTRTQGFLGSVLYASPEQARDRVLDVRTDIFSMGLSLYHSLTGQLAYDYIPDVDTTSEFDVISYLGHIARVNEQIEFQFPEEIPPAIREVIRKATRVRRGERYPNARAMHDALEDALRERQQTSPSPWLRRIVVAASALAAITLIALVSYIIGVKKRVDETIEEIVELEQHANLVMDGARSLEPAPTPDVMDQADQTLRSAGIILQAGVDNSRGWLTMFGSRNALERSKSLYLNACLGLTEGDLASRADASSSAVERQVTELRSARAYEHLPEAWEGLEATLGGLDPPGAAAGSCENADTQLNRLEAANSANGLIVGIRNQLPGIWDSLASIAFGRALKAQNKAQAEQADAPEYQMAVKQGDEAFARGKTHIEALDYRKAAETFNEAEKAYLEAIAIVPAVRARDNVMQALKTVEEEIHIVDDPMLGRIFSAAQHLYEGGHWSDARKEYDRALSVLESLLRPGPRGRGARLAANKASHARENAVGLGAEYVARDLVTRADGLLSEATDVLSKDPVRALIHFEEAKSVYLEAEAISKRVMIRVRKVENQAAQSRRGLLGSRSCSSLNAATAREECERAEELRAQADQALLQLDSPTAFVRFTAASEAYGRARELQDDPENNRPQIASRTPEGRLIKSHRDQPITLAVGAVHANRDSLQYTWLVDGELHPQTGSSLQLQLAKNADVEVRVTDGNTKPVTERWTIQITNRKPKLSVTPRDHAGPIELKPGARQEFIARASDPDNDPVQVEFKLGNQIAKGTSFTFAEQKPGDYKLRITAQDGQSKTTLFRTIRVVGEPVSVDKDKENAIRLTMKEYKTAYEAESMSRLKRVWKMSPQDEDDIQLMFDSCTSLNVDLTIKRVAVDDTEAEVEFAQEESGECGLFARFPSNDYRAQLLERRDGDWIIRKRRNETTAQQ